MGEFIKGDVVVVPFPFSDLSSNKRRPALVVADIQGDDVIMCQITSKKVGDSYAITLATDDFKSGKLSMKSNIRPNRLFTGNSKIILYRAGTLKTKKLDEVTDKIVEIFKA